jgi:hypothetical protein
MAPGSVALFAAAVLMTASLLGIVTVKVRTRAWSAGHWQNTRRVNATLARIGLVGALTGASVLALGLALLANG